ncbi:MAG: hypothetical protein ACK5GZ_17665 [Cyanobium sp.]|jgi:multiple antibiotic resistance protein
MNVAALTVGLLAMSDPVGLLSVVGQAGAGNRERLRRISRVAALTYGVVLVCACWWGPTAGEPDHWGDGSGF